MVTLLTCVLKEVCAQSHLRKKHWLPYQPLLAPPPRPRRSRYACAGARKRHCRALARRGTYAYRGTEPADRFSVAVAAGGRGPGSGGMGILGLWLSIAPSPCPRHGSREEGQTWAPSAQVGTRRRAAAVAAAGASGDLTAPPWSTASGHFSGVPGRGAERQAKQHNVPEPPRPASAGLPSPHAQQPLAPDQTGGGHGLWSIERLSTSARQNAMQISHPGRKVSAWATTTWRNLPPRNASISFRCRQHRRLPGELKAVFFTIPVKFCECSDCLRSPIPSPTTRFTTRRSQSPITLH